MNRGILTAAFKAKKLDVVRLKAEVDEIIYGSLPLERMELYEQDELLFVAKNVTRRARTAHEKLAELAQKYNVDLTRTKMLQASHRLHYSDQELDEKRAVGLKTHIRELIVGIHAWTKLDHWEERWSKKKNTGKATVGSPPPGGE